ncbi:MAG: RNA polymerase sigma factor [Candidatus Rokubacteria bacterium]|nr:RNA polymerase sigma factor [Candidatus Rokubacteria bacterium]
MTVGQEDLELVQGLRDGRTGAVETLVARHGPWIYRLALRLTGSPPDAEEVAQDALLRIIQKIDTFKGEAAFTSWVYRIAANLAYQKLRSRPGREEVSIDDLLPVFDEMGAHTRMITDWSDQAEDQALSREAREHLERAIDLLPAEYKVVFVLHDMEGRPNAEIAELLDLSLPAVKSRVHRARLFLRAKLADYFERPA